MEIYKSSGKTNFLIQTFVEGNRITKLSGEPSKIHHYSLGILQCKR